MRYLIIIALLLLSGIVYAETMPDFKLPDINNKEVKLADLLGSGPILIDFWASYCEPCKKAMPALQQLVEKYDSLTVVLISIDAPKDIAKAKSYLKSKGYPFVALFDSEKKLAKKLNVVNPPQTFILDKTGNIIYSHTGYEPGAEKEYDKLIGELTALPCCGNKTEETKEQVSE